MGGIDYTDNPKTLAVGLKVLEITSWIVLFVHKVQIYAAICTLPLLRKMGVCAPEKEVIEAEHQ